MIYALKIFPDVAFQNVFVFPAKNRVAVNGCMGSLAGSTGERIVNKGFVEDGFDHVAQGVVNHPVRIWGCADQPFFGVMHDKVFVPAMTIVLRREFLMQRQ